MEGALLTTTNQVYADTIIAHLVKGGIRHFCIAPGSRSTPLVLSASHHPLATTHVHYDERGLGFYALGMAKAKQAPVALIVTSGTALGNLMPAVMEARHSHTPLVVISADRPFELHDTHANQTVNQSQFFGDFVSHYTLIPPPEESIPIAAIRSTIAFAAMKAKTGSLPIHINAMFRPPLTPHESTKRDGLEHGIQFVHPRSTLDIEDFSFLIDPINETEKGLIAIGSNAGDTTPILKLAEKLNWPVFADITSSARRAPQSHVIPHAALILKRDLSHISPEVILTFGDRFVSQDLNPLLKGAQVIEVVDHTDRSDPTHSVSTRICAPPQLFCDAILPHLFERSESSYLSTIKGYSESIAHYMNLPGEEAPLTEPLFFSHLSRHFDPSHALFIGNSLAIRAADYAFYPRTSIGPIFANRGCSGIDGNIATIAGIASGLEKPVMGVIGDQTFLHDLNSIPLIRELPITLVVINNQGGRIFDHLPVAKDSSNTKDYFVNHSPFPLDASATLFDIPYAVAHTMGDFGEMVKNPKQGGQIIELVVEPAHSLREHQKLIQEAQKSKKGRLAQSLSCYFT